jgi:hypothetical protein
LPDDGIAYTALEKQPAKLAPLNNPVVSVDTTSGNYKRGKASVVSLDHEIDRNSLIGAENKACCDTWWRRCYVDISRYGVDLLTAVGIVGHS